jgi:hypothetical protein
MLHHPMRRSKKEITDPDQMHAIIAASPVMRLAMCRDDEPYLIPLSFGFDGDAIYFHCAPEGLKVDILRRNPRVCCLFEGTSALDVKGTNPCAWGFSFATVIVHGSAEQVLAPEAKLSALQCITDHYAENAPLVPSDKIGNVDVWKIEILEMRGKRSE